MPKATIDAVAALAGVSIKTVSRVVNGEPHVRENTREKVLAAIAELNYRPNQSARRLAGNRSYLIALLYDNPSASYVIDVQSGVLEECRGAGFDLIIHPCDYRSRELVDEIEEVIRHSSLDGIILTPPVSDNRALVEYLRGREIPFARISPADDDYPEFAVRTNDQEVCQSMATHLAALGHTNIAFVLGHPDHRAVALRFEGFKEGLKAVGLSVRDECVVQGYNSFESGQECAEQLLSLETPPTAVFCSNDDMAAGVINVAHARGLSVPAQLSVAGFDDIPLAKQLWPPLTTVRQPIRDMAKAATKILLEQIRPNGNGPQESLVASSVIKRASTARLN